MLHSLFLTHWYPSETNPVYGTFIREHARAVSLYHKVTVIHIQGINQANPYISKEQDGSITVYSLRYPRPRIPKTGWWNRWQGVNRITKSLVTSHNPPDIFHAHVYNTADLAYGLRKKFRIPAVLTEHSTNFPRNRFTKTQIFQNRLFLNRIDLIMPVSDDLGHHIRSHGIYTAQNTIPSPVDTTIFYPPKYSEPKTSTNKHILCVASLIPRKGLDRVILAFNKLQLTRSDLQLTIIGDGPSRASLEYLAADFDLLNSVKFIGAKTKSEVANYMRKSQLLVLTSYYENQPSVILEAFACGLPVVTTSVGGIPEVVKPFCGCLVNPGDIDGIANSIAFVIDNINKFPSARIAEYGYSEFSHQVIGKKQSAIYESVITEYKRPR